MYLMQGFKLAQLFITYLGFQTYLPSDVLMPPKQVSLCVKRLVYTDEKGEIVKGVCSNFLCKDYWL